MLYMFKASQILKFKTASETVARNIFEIQESAGHSDYEDFLKRMVLYMSENIVIPILRHSIEDIEKEFVKHIPSVGVMLKELNTTLYEKKNEDLSEVTKEVFSYYNLLKQYIKEDPVISANVRVKILELLESLNDFDSIYLGIAMTRQEQLEKTLVDIESEGDIDDLGKNIAGTALAFFSVLVFAKEGMNDDKKLEKLLKIAYEYSKGLESWADTIDIMSNPESVEAMKEGEKIATKE
jgi:hypothetical protein